METPTMHGTRPPVTPGDFAGSQEAAPKVTALPTDEGEEVYAGPSAAYSSDPAWDWTPEHGQASPEGHPLWPQQVLLERGMLREGAKAVQDQVAKAAEKRTMATLAPVRSLISEWLPIVAKGITEWVKDAHSTRGVRKLALQYLDGFDPEVAALVGLREILNGVMVGRCPVTALCISIGRTIEHEAKVRLWEQEEPDLFHRVGAMLTLDGATAAHRARVNINRFNHHLRAGTFGFGWRDWTDDAQFQVGAAIVDVILRYTQWFEVADDPTFKPKRGARAHSAAKVLAPRPGLTAYLGAAFDHAEVTSPKFKPTLIPPKRWTSTRSGGYWTPYVQPPRLVRFKPSQRTQRANATDEYDALDLSATLDAVHTLQETAWTVNSRVLAVALRAWAMDMPMGNGFGIGKLPLIQEEDLPLRSGKHEAYLAARDKAKRAGNAEPVPSKKLQEEMRQWMRRAKRVRGRNAKRTGRMRSTTTIIQLAEEFDGKEFYYPHMLDFRGRVYPIPSALQPQGSDLARGLLTFAGGAALTAENDGPLWLAFHLANCWGKDKVSLDARVAWVRENEALWRSIAADPLGDLRWAGADGEHGKCDKPWQALAAIFEWVAYLDHGEGFVSYLPVMVDGSCNGIQHLSAIIRDEVAGAQVNLTPSDAPADIYQEAADRLFARVLEAADDRETAHLREYWLARSIVLNGRQTFPRSLTKRQTMVLPYGGTITSCFDYTEEWLDDADPAPEEDYDKAAFVLRMDRIRWLSGHLWKVLNELVAGGMEVMKWLQACAKATAVGNQPILWITPAGFVVRHFYGRVKMRRVDTLLDGQRYQLHLAEFTDELDLSSQTKGVPPNFIHSLDAAALATCVNLCVAMGLDQITTIHDAYGTHAGNMWTLARMIRQSFVETHKVSPLEGFRGACFQILTDYHLAEGLDLAEAERAADEALPRLPALGCLDLIGILESDYFFA